MRISNTLAALHNSTALAKQQQDTGQPVRDRQVTTTADTSLGKQAVAADTYEAVLQGEVVRERQQTGAIDSRARVLQGEAISPASTNPAAARRAIDQFLQAQPATTTETEAADRHIDVYA